MPVPRDVTEGSPDGHEGRGFAREQILDEAIRLLEEHGSIGFRLHDLAERLDVTVSALYYHFRNREAIIQAAYLESFVRDTEANLQLAASFASLDPANDKRHELLRERVEELRSERLRHLRLSRMTALTSVVENDAAKLEVTKAIQRSHRVTTEAYAEAQRQGLMASTLSPAALSLVTRSFLCGLILWDFDDTVDVSIEDVTQVIEVIMRRLSSQAVASGAEGQ